MSDLILLLPQLKADADIKSGDRAGEWHVQGSKAFTDVATSLSYESPEAVRNISSVPTMWARPLTVEMVLYDQRSSLRDKMIAEWQGMLAAIALAEIRGFPITAKLIELGQLRYEQKFAKSLFELLPDYKGRNLYTLADNKHPWEDIYVFLWNDKPIGMTSPTTIVVPSEEIDLQAKKGNNQVKEASWQSIPWWDSRAKIFQSPQEHLNKNEQALLWLWLENLNQALNKHNGDEKAINLIKGLIVEFKASLRQDPAQRLILSEDEVFFKERINRGVLEALNYPLKAPDTESSVRLVPSREKAGNGKPPLLIYDPEMARVWNQKPQNIWIHGGKTLASLKLEEFSTFQQQWTVVNLVEPEELFFPELKFIEQEDALPGALSPQVEEPLVFNSQRITPIIPLNPVLLDYLTPEELLSKIKFQTLRTGEGIKIRLNLDLPLSGVKENQESENYRLYKDYDLKEENSLGDQLPVLQIWPHLQTQDWHEYYVFYYDGELEDRTFKITYPQSKKAHSFKEGFGTFLMYIAEEFPEYLTCTNFENQEIGLVLFQPPAKIRASHHWQVGVDFGTSFTNIYINLNRQELPQPLELNNLQLQVTSSSVETRINTLFENFIPETFQLVPENPALPLSSVLTTRGKDPGNPKMLPILDGRIYVPNLATFEPQQDWIKTNLKWSLDNRLHNEVFLKNLALYISALAAEAGVQEIQWSLSYPSAFSRTDILNYADAWSNLTTELGKTTGIQQNYPEIDSEHFRTESLAIAQYFADFEDKDLVYTTCIDMGGGTSDISIWEDNTLVHQCSVQLAGRDIFSQFLKINPKFAEEKFKFDPKEWKGLGVDAFSAKLDVWLRYESRKWLAEHRVLQREDKDFQGLTRLMTIGIAGLYYYVGILLKVLFLEEKYKRGKITPVYIGGNASRFLNWLDERGKFDQHSELNELLSRMLSAGSTFKDTEAITNLSDRPKDEAACGLVFNATKLKGLGKREEDPIIAGETCFINGKEFGSDQRLTLGNNLDKNTILGDDSDKEIKEFTITELVEVPKFLYEFHKAIRDLKLDSITGLKNYHPSTDKNKNSKIWEDTKRELDNMLLAIKGDSKNIRPESGFILGLKALLIVLGKQWASK